MHGYHFPHCSGVSELHPHAGPAAAGQSCMTLLINTREKVFIKLKFT